MSVIVSRALPDVRDGLKPVHRRILYSMQDMGAYNTATKKSARIVGEVLGKYHPHGDSSVYDAMVRMAQDFSMRYPLSKGRAISAAWITTLRLPCVIPRPGSGLAGQMLLDIDKDTVDFIANFDESLKEPTVLPALLPNLLVNGSSGIAVGMATNIPPHNLGEVCDAIAFLVDKPKATVEEIIQFIKGPDFPTAGIILGKRWNPQRLCNGSRPGRGTGQGHISDIPGGMGTPPDCSH